MTFPKDKLVIYDDLRTDNLYYVFTYKESLGKKKNIRIQKVLSTFELTK